MATENPVTPHRKRIEVAIAIVFDRAGQVLICQRKPDAVLGGYWEFPGGKCNFGESPDACAVREVEEEVGVAVEVIRALPEVEHDYDHGSVVLHPFVCELRGGILELREVAQALWIQPEDITQYRFPEANTGLVRAIAAGECRI